MSVDDVWGDSELILKVKEPQDGEWQKLSPGQVLFTYLHLAAAPELTEALLEQRRTPASPTRPWRPRIGKLPLLAPMSEVAGRLSAQVGAYYLMKPFGGRGRLMGGVPGVLPAKVLVLGGGVGRLQRGADRAGMQADVTIFDAQRRPDARARRSLGRPLLHDVERATRSRRRCRRLIW